MAMRSFYNEIKGLKLRDLPEHVKPRLTIDNLKKSLQRGFENYQKTYIDTNSFAPVYHVCFGGMAFSYLVGLPEERRRHLEHQKHAKEHGGH